MPEFQAPPQPHTSAQYFFTPLMISMACMFATLCAIVTYHFLVVNYCVSRRLPSPNPSPSPRPRRFVAVRRAQGTSAATWNNRNSPVGVEEKVLGRIPILSYTVDSNCQSKTDCVVCLGEMEEGDAVRMLPNCRHVFHVACIDRWFLAHSSCPVCRSSVTPPPPDQAESLPMTDPAVGHVGSQLRRLSSASTVFLRRAVSMVFPTEAEKLRHGCGEHLRRSSSMDPSDVVITVSNDIPPPSDIGCHSSSSQGCNHVGSSALESGVSTTTASSSSSSQLRIHDVMA